VAHTAHDQPDLGELVALLATISRRLRGAGQIPPALRDAFQSGALGPRHMPPLFALARSGPISVGELAQRVGLASATASLLLGELSRVGLVERREDDHDRRRTIVSVPEPHRRLLADMARERLGLMQRTLARLDPDARRSFIAGLRILADESQAMAGDGQPPAQTPAGGAC
jgi:DNA-binding MarR family transcriptional regulator